ncbi:secretion protein [Methylosinus sp. PW1]|uniref:secretion protein n=1 Tax=Methylosinus sp. PW1 TaxID=107636 RepID=UPI0005689196|nr:secretion protein [Methylosinus sp. PW1]
MLQWISRGLAAMSLMAKQPLASFCDIEASHGDALVTKHGDYVSFLRLGGMRRMSTRADIDRLANAMRIDISGTLENRGHAIVGWYASDPDLAAVEIERVNMSACREIAKEIGLELGDIFEERKKLWTGMMRWEAAYFILWTRATTLTKEERKQMKEEQAASAKKCPNIGDAQKFHLRSDVMAARHTGFVSRVVSSLKGLDVAATEISAHDALVVAREAMYRETVGSGWRPTLVGDAFRPRWPDEKDERPILETLMWPAIRDLFFDSDAIVHDGQRVEIGLYDYGCVDMTMGPEDPRPFVELSSRLGQDRVPWRVSFVIEGGGNSDMLLKSAGAQFLWMFPSNRDITRAFEHLKRERENNNHIAVRLRASFATWAPFGEVGKLRLRLSTLKQRLEAWGNCRGTTVIGDPLEGVMGSVPGLALASTAPPSVALIGDVLAMLPWGRTASPWDRGSVLFRQPNGAMWPYDPSGGSKRPQVLDTFVAPPRSGKSVLANTINLGLCLSSVALGAVGAKLPLIGKVDIGDSAEGFVLLVQEALGPQRRHEAIYTRMQFAQGFEFNVFDLQVGCAYPLPLEKAFLQNFLALITLPPDQSTPFEGMNQMIGIVIDEAYRLCTDVPGASPKRYRRGVEPLIDAAIERHGVELHHDEPHWRDVVQALYAVGDYRLAEVAQRHAVPVLEDLVGAARTDQVKDMFGKLTIAMTAEQASDLFERYIYDVIRKFPTLNSPTRLDFGAARIIVMDLAEVAPTGSAAANRQTEMMYMLARHIIARNFFLKPDYLPFVPAEARGFHQPRFQEIYESVKRLDYDEWHRTQGSPQVRAQAELDVREGPKHNVQLGFASQRLSDMGDAIVSQSTGRFVLRAGDDAEAEEIVQRFNLSEASADIVRHRLHGPGPAGAPFLAVLQADNAKYEQMLVNTLGPIELWALSTTPGDRALRNRLYDRIGFREALRRLARIFPGGSAEKEIEERKAKRMRRGELDARAETGVIDELADELADARGIGAKLRYEDSGSTFIAAAAQ